MFLVFRVREELRRGLTPHDAVIQSVSRVGESITFSAFTVIAALVSLVLAEFAFYQSLGPGAGDRHRPDAAGRPDAAPRAAGHLRPGGLLADRRGGAARTPEGAWDRVGVVATRRPGPTLAAGLILFGGLAATLLTTGVAGFGNVTSSPSGTDSAAGSALIQTHFPSSTTGRSAVLLQFPTSVWDNPSVLAGAQSGLTGLAEFSGLVGPLNPNGIPLTTDQLTQLHTTLGPARQLPAVPTTSDIPAQLYNAYRTTGQLISPDGHTVQYSVEFANGDASSPAVLDSVPAMRADVERVAQSVGASASGVFGQVAFASDVSHISGTDLVRIIPIVSVLIAILLAIVLRSLVAPLYLVASIVLSYLAALGLVGLVFVHFGGQDGINFLLPFLMFVFLMALGSDYNILIMSRIREEAHELPLRDAVARAIGRTGSTITTAGVILAGTFAVLAVAGARRAVARSSRSATASRPACSWTRSSCDRCSCHPWSSCLVAGTGGRRTWLAQRPGAGRPRARLKPNRWPRAPTRRPEATHEPGDIGGRHALLRWFTGLTEFGFGLRENDVFGNDENVCALSWMGDRRPGVEAATRSLTPSRSPDT